MDGRWIYLLEFEGYVVSYWRFDRRFHCIGVDICATCYLQEHQTPNFLTSVLFSNSGDSCLEEVNVNNTLLS